MAQPAKVSLELLNEESNNKNNRILIIDDEEQSRLLCKRFLEEEGYLIEVCGEGKKAVELLTRHVFDLVLADLAMPDMNGVELVKHVKYHHPQTNVIIMTAFGSITSAVESMKSGAYDYITKPFPRDILRATVKRCLESHNLKREISKMQMELIKKDRLAAVGAMAGAIAHRMRNPLNIIQMCAQYLQGQLGGNQEHQEILQAVEEKVKVLEQLTRDFVEYSRASRIKKTPEHMEKLSDEVIQECEPRCKIQGVEVIRRYQNDLPVVMVDADLIREVFTNIISNALEAMKGEGKIIISIGLDRSINFILIAISNSGSVLPKELQEKIFEPFFTTKETGMGLGLAIVKQVVDGHGGKIQVSGDTNTNSTTFRFIIPLKETGESKIAK
ncbi:MAG: response regulator [Elusimicrobiota bacterium]